MASPSPSTAIAFCVDGHTCAHAVRCVSACAHCVRRAGEAGARAGRGFVSHLWAAARGGAEACRAKGVRAGRARLLPCCAIMPCCAISH